MKKIEHTTLLVKPGIDIRLAEFDRAFTAGFRDKHDAKEKLCEDVEHLGALQDIFYSDKRYALLIVFQGITRAAVGDVIVERLKELGLKYSTVSDQQRAALVVERRNLADETPQLSAPALALALNGAA